MLKAIGSPAMRGVVAAVLALGAAGPAAAASQSPYAGQDARAIKALSAGDVADLMDGKGMGLAKAAELNGYPGPAHVLELGADLQLTADQRGATEALYHRMQDEARAVGRDLIDAEQALDALFAGRSATPEAVDARVARIGALQAKLRSVHLNAHLAQIAILTRDQVARYAALRGYGTPNADGGHAPHRHLH
jgi:hypothetical protein